MSLTYVAQHASRSGKSPCTNIFISICLVYCAVLRRRVSYNVAFVCVSLRCHVCEGDKAVSIDTAHARLRQRQCQPAPTLRVRARRQRKPGLTKQRVCKIIICC